MKNPPHLQNVGTKHGQPPPSDCGRLLWTAPENAIHLMQSVSHTVQESNIEVTDKSIPNFGNIWQNNPQNFAQVLLQTSYR